MKTVKFDACKMHNMSSGLGQFCFHLGNAIHRLNKDYEFTALQLEVGTPEYRQQFHTERVSSLHKFLLRVQADVLHLTHQESFLEPARASCKTLLTIHDLNFIHKEMPEWKRRIKLKRIQKKINRSSAVVCISEYVKNECAAHLDLESKPVHVIYNGVPLIASAPEKPTWMDESRFLFSMGIFQKRKNFEVLIPMLHALPEYTLIIAGKHDESYYPFLQQLAAKEKLTHRVLFPGEISEAQKHWLYANCEAFLFPSLAEGFGLPVAEAMSFGKPVLLSNYTSLPEIGSTLAHYFSDYSPRAMAELTKKALSSHTEILAAESKKYVSKFTWEQAALSYNTLYQQLLQA